MKAQTQTFRNRSGFSLVEILTVIAVIAVIVGIAVPMMQNVHKSAALKGAMREAQTIAASFSAGVASGSTELIGLGTVDEVIDQLVEGVTGLSTSEAVEPISVKLTPLSEERREAVTRYLTLENGFLIYTPTE